MAGFFYPPFTGHCEELRSNDVETPCYENHRCPSTAQKETDSMRHPSYCLNWDFWD
jgi:hypothetical protein